MNNIFNIGDIVKPATKLDAFALCSGLTPPRVTTETKFRVEVIIEEGQTYHGREKGLILSRVDLPNTFCYPYVWNFDRFVKA